MPGRIIHAMCGLIDSGCGMLLEKDGHNQLRMIEQWNMADIEAFNSRELESLYNFFTDQEWVIDFDEYRREPGFMAI